VMFESKHRAGFGRPWVYERWRVTRIDEFIKSGWARDCAWF
jgi:hypothetical protein